MKCQGLFTEKQRDFPINIPCQVCCWQNSTGYPGLLLEKSDSRLLTTKKVDWISSLLPAEHPHNSQPALTEWEQQEKQTCSIERMQPCDLRADQIGYNTPFAGVLQLLALTSWHCHHKCPAAFSLDTCISLTNTAETNPRWGATTAQVDPHSCLSFWRRSGATSSGKVEIWMCWPRGCVYVPADTHLHERMDAVSRGLCICLSAASCCKLEP